jgi:hypothetical protein
MEDIKLLQFVGDYEPVTRPLTNQHQRKILILGQEYSQSWYDWYIMDAIKLASLWKSHQITFDRIMHLRYWVRENVQHSHNYSYLRCKTVKSCKEWLAKVINSEYKFSDDDDEYVEMEKRDLKENIEIFSRKNDIKNQSVDIDFVADIELSDD